MPTKPEADVPPAIRSGAAGERIAGFDIARGLAILGMVVVHFSLVMAADHSGPDRLNIVLGFLDGRAAATFVILAGIGVTLMSRRGVASSNPDAIAKVRGVLCRRGVLLLVLGFVNLCFWPGDILRVYGVSLLLATGLIAVSNRGLLLSALACALGFVAVFLALDFDANWDWATLNYHGLWTPTGLLRNLFYDGFRSVLPWTGFVYFGMWLGRLKLCNPAVNRRVLATALVTAVGAEAVSRLCVSYILAHSRGMSAETVKALFGTESMPALPLFLLAGGGEAVAVIALCVRLSGEARSRIWQPLIATGQMALTWYFAHIVLGLGTVEALGLVNSQPLPVAASCGLAFFAVAVLLSWIWKTGVRHGPLEWGMRKIAG